LIRRQRYEQMDFFEYTNLLEEGIQNGVLDQVAVRQFYDQSILLNRISEAREVFDKLQKVFSGNREILSLNIALCLQQYDYSTAIVGIESLISICTPDDGLIDAGLNVRSKIDPPCIEKSNYCPNTVSLCMITKNEVAGIGACLHWAKPLVNEIIVVDTGSSDRTKDVAKIFGAKTFDYAWCEDFAAARNFSLDNAQGEWILIIDADELIASCDHEAFRNLVAENCGRRIAFSIETRNYTNIANTIGWHANNGQYPQHETGLGWFPSRKVRLFPNKKQVRFCHPVHEQVEIALKNCDIPICDCRIPVHHYGELNEAKKQKKAKVYFQLGYAKLEKFGHDFQAIRELASQAGQIELWSEAIQLWEHLLKTYPNNAEAYINISSAYWHLGAYEKALAAAYKSLILNSSSREAKYNAAVSLLMLNRITDAIKILEEIVASDAEYLPAQFMLAVSYICRGDSDRGQKLLGNIIISESGDVVKHAMCDVSNRFKKANLDAYTEALRYVEEKVTIS
jgi:glycosyltransferase involved in cell wall biosynthesis